MGLGKGRDLRAPSTRHLAASVICADPPWKFSDKLTMSDTARGAEQQYPCMSVKELCAWQLPCAVAEDAHLYLWRVSSMQREALDVGEAWGFRPVSELVWLKRTSKGKRHFGMGRTVRLEHEVALIFKRGKGAPMLNHSTRSTFEAPTGRHSEKPDEFYEIIKSLHGGARVELFARKPRAGFTVYGNEIPGGYK